MGWDEAGQPHPAALRRTSRTELEPDRLPEVRELAEFGWEPAPQAPLWVFLPYVWPEDDRVWVPDRSTRWAVETRTDAAGRITGVRCDPLSPDDLAVLESDANADLAAVGVPARPAGRVWLLRPPSGFDDLDAVLDHLCEAADRRGVEQRLSAAFVDLCGEVMASLTGRVTGSR
ncbi:DUF5956 family protein [Actinacidiphila sp. ITFR-21]|uniref:DUF5956 family protein n=1 Tax=Actinacidiphila sp. ITFR-21 TaxID=3075199 RepID=UPI00288C4F13|nr:DUF5956 family protein [Streptomyces sp. ITFR-21]WNI18146.1 DUF5956 family protein [Streptomyces sp. ITFR-21]